MMQVFRWIYGIVVMLGLPILLFSLGQTAYISPVGFGISIVFSLLMALVLGGLILRSPLWPHHISRRWVLVALLWGMSAGILASTLSFQAWEDLSLLMDWPEAAASFAGAYPEEIAKAAGVLLIMGAIRWGLRPWHGVGIGMMVGLGFELIENIIYGAGFAPLHVSSDAWGALEAWGLRLAMGGFFHMVWTGMAGWGIGLALTVAGRSTAWRWCTAGLWLAVPFCLHFAWNYSGPLPLLPVLMVLSYGIFLAVAIYAWRKASRDDSYILTPGLVTEIQSRSADSEASTTLPEISESEATSTTFL